MENPKKIITDLGFNEEVTRTFDFINEVTSVISKNTSSKNLLTVAKNIKAQEKIAIKNVMGFNLVIN